MTDLILTDVRPWGQSRVDVLIDDGVITELRPTTGAVEDGTEHLDGRGLLALPGLVNAHAHVDKSWWGRPWVPSAGADTVPARIAHERAERDRHDIPSVDGAVAVLRQFIRHGTTATRTHVDVDLGLGLRALEHVKEAEHRLDGAIDVQIVAFPQDGVVRRPGVLDLLDQAAVAGAAWIGGLDPAGIDRDPVEQLDGLFAIAERRGVGLDIHLHDRGELGAFQFELIIERTRATGLQGKVNVSHGFALGELPWSRQGPLLDELAEAGISWTTVAPPGTAPLPWDEMVERGIGLGLGTDGIRDLWSPFGDGDMLGIALGFARLHGLRLDDELTTAVRLASSMAAPFVGRTSHDLVPGARADLVLLDAENVPDALVRVPPRELVVSGGRVVAEQDAAAV